MPVDELALIDEGPADNEFADANVIRPSGLRASELYLRGTQAMRAHKTQEACRYFLEAYQSGERLDDRKMQLIRDYLAQHAPAKSKKKIQLAGTTRTPVLARDLGPIRLDRSFEQSRRMAAWNKRGNALTLSGASAAQFYNPLKSRPPVQVVVEREPKHDLVSRVEYAYADHLKDNASAAGAMAAPLFASSGRPTFAFGEAGAIVTNDEALTQKIRTLRDHGQVRKYHHAEIGWNCRMDGLQAAVLSIKLNNLDRGNALRRKNAAVYDDLFAEIDEIRTPTVAAYAEHVYHIYAVRVPEREHAVWLLGKKGIQFGIHYPVPIHRQKAYQSLGYGIGSFPVAETLAQQLISLPMFPELTRSQIDMVVYALKDAALAAALA